MGIVITVAKASYLLPTPNSAHDIKLQQIRQMKTLVTGSAGHPREALVRTLRAVGDQPVGIDIKNPEFTDHVGNIADRAFVRSCTKDCESVLHTATLHKPHVGTHSRQDFIDTNISGTLNLLEESLENGCQSFI